MAEPLRRQGAVEPTRAHVLVVEARFYDHIADALLTGARDHLDAAGSTYEVFTVPGALEVPATIAILVEAAAARGNPYDAAVALGCVIRGETTHYEIVSEQSARGLMDLSVALRLPLGNGVLTVEDEAQALARALPHQMDKGGGAAEAALVMVRLKRRMEA